MATSSSAHNKAATEAKEPVETKSSKRPAEVSPEEKSESKRHKQDLDTEMNESIVIKKQDNLMFFIGQVQEEAWKERVNFGSKLKDEQNKTKELEAKLAKMTSYKGRARKAEEDFKTQKELTEQLKVEFKQAQDKAEELERRLATIASVSNGEPSKEAPLAASMVKKESVESSTGTVTVTTDKKKNGNGENKKWTKEECRILYSEHDRTGKNSKGQTNWVEIIKKLPGVTNYQAFHKWKGVDRPGSKSNSIEEAFVGAMVKEQNGDEELIGTVADYNMDQNTRVGTWTITFSNGTTKRVKKTELLVAWRLYTEQA